MREEQIAFAMRFPFGAGWPEDMVRRFLTQLVSDDSLILESSDEQGRLALGVLIDRVKNPGANANLEILGVRQGAMIEPAVSRLLSLAKDRLPTHFVGFEVGLTESLSNSSEFLQTNHLKPYYQSFGMSHPDPSSAEPPPAQLCTVVTDRDEEELYQVLVRCMKDNVDTSIPEFDEWRAARRAPSRSKSWGVWKDKKLVAFVSLWVPRGIAVAEIRTLGVLPEHRGNGYAKALIRRALSFTAQLEIPQCLLTVAVHNREALHLYEGLGFRVVEHRPVFRYLRGPEILASR